MKSNTYKGWAINNNVDVEVNAADFEVNTIIRGNPQKEIPMKKLVIEITAEDNKDFKNNVVQAARRATLEFNRGVKAFEADWKEASFKFNIVEDDEKK